MKTTLKYVIIALVSIGLAACSDEFFEIDNNGVATGDELSGLGESSPEALIENVLKPLQVGIYSYLIEFNTAGATSGSPHYDFGWMSIGHHGDVMNDDLALHTQGNGMFTYDYQLDYWGQQYVKPFYWWNFCYTLVAKANELISKIDADTQVPELKAILGQALAIRAAGHAYAVQMYQQTYIGNEDAPGVPIILTTNEEGSNPGRAPLRDVYARIETDFKRAIDLLDGWQRPNKVYIDKNVAAGLYARICLVTNNWDDAVTYARIARQGYSPFTAAELLADGFNDINAKEWIWGGDITSETQSAYASFFSFVCSFDAGYGGAVGCFRKMDKKLYDAMSPTDVRRQQFKVGNNVSPPGSSNFPDYTNVKFKRVEGWLADYVFMRVSEMILTEAEALARSGQTGPAATVLRDLMSNRDPSWNATSVTGDEVYQQRRLELWAEGFSLFDHLRLKKGIDRKYAGSNHYTPSQYKISGGSWYFLYQLPLRELDNNGDIDASEQNPTPTGTKFED
jgi:hypothetical protein